MGVRIFIIIIIVVAADKVPAVVKMEWIILLRLLCVQTNHNLRMMYCKNNR